MALSVIATQGNVSVSRALFALGFTAIGSVILIAIITALNRFSTHQWKTENPENMSYSSVFKRTFYKASRVKWLTYFSICLLALGVVLVVAGGIAKLVG